MCGAMNCSDRMTEWELSHMPPTKMSKGDWKDLKDEAMPGNMGAVVFMFDDDTYIWNHATPPEWDKNSRIVCRKCRINLKDQMCWRNSYVSYYLCSNC